MRYYRELIIKGKEYNKDMSLVYKELHNQPSVGVTFPLHSKDLGRVIRVFHNSKEILEALELSSFNFGPIKEVPLECKYQAISRIRPRKERAKIRRLIKRGNTKLTEREYLLQMLTEGLENPYLNIKSNSNGNYLKLFFGFGEVEEVKREGVLTSYGFNKGGNLPLF